MEARKELSMSIVCAVTEDSPAPVCVTNHIFHIIALPNTHPSVTNNKPFA
jgi:hypothetical protein